MRIALMLPPPVRDVLALLWAMPGFSRLIAGHQGKWNWRTFCAGTSS
jgi:hypothetical protein